MAPKPIYEADFLGKVGTALDQSTAAQLESNQLFQNVRDYIPGASTADKKKVIDQNFQSTRGWMSDLVSKRGITQDKIADSLSRFAEMSDRKLDYLAAFLDMTTNYYEHTGTQSLARRLIDRAVNEI